MTRIVMGRNLFESFDKQARREVGVGLTTFGWGERPERKGMGFFNRRGAIYQTPSGAVLHPVIEIANSIPLEEVEGSEGPEIMRDAVPPEMLYAYVFAHEVGHAYFDLACIDAKLAEREDLKYTLMCFNEYRADRFAWKAVMGNKKLPYRKGGKKLMRRVLAGIESLKDHLGQHAHPNRGEPLPDSWKLKEKPVFHQAA